MDRGEATLPKETDALIVGGGATGLGIALDIALRGVKPVLVEKRDFCAGTSGRHHGMLHSGARYAVGDPDAAVECLEENIVLRRIARSAVEDTGGIFVLLPGGDPGYADKWLAGCRAVGIPAEEMGIKDLYAREPNAAPGIRAAFSVPDGGLHAVPLGYCLARAANGSGALLLDWYQLENLLVRDGRVHGGRVRDLRTGETREIHARVVLNAAGAWGGEVARMASLKVDISFNRGALVAFEGRRVHSIIQHLRPPSDFDSVLPRGRLSIAGTTAIATDEPGDRRVEEWEKEAIRKQACLLVPSIADARLVHGWSAVRPLFDTKAAAAGKASRALSRRFTVIDHEADDGMPGLISVLGGKLTTYRLMAEKAVDLACRKLGVSAPCSTATTPI
jgi:glycerol-3-phosphate dehydrogenase